MTKRWRFDIDALPTHSFSPLSHCASASGRLEHTTKRAEKGTIIAVSSSMPGCTVAPTAHRAKMLNGLSPVVSRPSAFTTPFARSSSRILSTPCRRASARAARKCSAELSTGSAARQSASKP